MANTPPIFFQPQPLTHNPITTAHPNGGTIYHNLELFIWKLRQTHPTGRNTLISAPHILSPSSSSPYAVEPLQFTEFHDITARPLHEWIQLLRSTFGSPTHLEQAVQSWNDALDPSRSSALAIDTSRIYRFVNRAVSDECALAYDPRGDRAFLWSTGLVPSDLFYFVEVEEEEGCSVVSRPMYRVRCLPVGHGKSLDVVNSGGMDSRELKFAATGRYSGQMWSVWKWEESVSAAPAIASGVGDGTAAAAAPDAEAEAAPVPGYRDVMLTNNFTRESKCLTLKPDVGGNSEMVLGSVENNDPKMHWDLVDVGSLEMVREDLV